MAEVLRYVDTDVSGGAGDGTSLANAYSSANAWEAAEETDLVTDGDTHRVRLCATGGSADDGNGCTIDGWTTGSGNGIICEVPESYRHEGKRSNSAYRMEADDWTASWYVNEGYVKCYDILCGSNANETNFRAGSHAGIEFHRCIAYDGGYDGFYLRTVGNTAYCYNCAALNNGYDGFYQGEGTAELYNCTSMGNTGDGFECNSYRTLNAYNCYGGGSGGSDYNDNAGDGNVTLTTCYSEDGSLSTSTAAYSTSSGAYFTNVTSGSEDPHISSDSTLLDVGTDYSGTFTDDIDGDTRSNWSVGVDDGPGVSNLSISVSDAVGTAESIGPAQNLGDISRFDNVSLAEFVAMIKDILINRSDEITVTESVALLKDMLLSRSDAITVAEFIRVLKDALPEVFSEISIAEFVQLAMHLQPSVFDVISLEEAVTLLLGAVNLSLSAYDEVGITENISGSIEDTIGADQIITITEWVQVQLEEITGHSLSVSDAVGILEELELRMNMAFGSGDDLSISEYINLQISELPALQISPNDLITLAELVQAKMSDALLSSSEAISVAETVTLSLPLADFAVYDEIAITELINVALLSGVNVFDSINILEAITLLKDITPDKYDAVSLSEFVSVVLSAFFAVTDNVTVAEWVHVSLQLATGLLNITFSAKTPGISFSGNVSDIS